MATVTRYFRVDGLVQGVGFRPTVYRVAKELGLVGEVFNDAEGVGIYLVGSESVISEFPKHLVDNKPPLARIDSIREMPCEARFYEDFTITASLSGKVSTNITADAATCQQCLTDIFSDSNRRWRYAFTNCTHCGPRFTITRHLPYDRPQTSMATFAMCSHCQAEYDNPSDRRFHAQPNACPVCGPRLQLTMADRVPLSGDPIAMAVAAIRDGRIVAVKGLGGFHLVCDARNPDAVARLRQRKKRYEKPLAIMVANVESAKRLVEIEPEALPLLTGPQRPIVLLPKKLNVELEGIAPRMSDYGVMLPYTPVHWLLFHELAGRPEGIDWIDSKVIDEALVMTSANPGGEPLVIGNEEAYERLGDIADLWLVHDREILIRCDDSVVRMIHHQPVFIRRARGYVPEGIRVPKAIPSVLATGAHLKNAGALSRNNEIFLTQHTGDLDNRVTCVALDEALQHLENILEIQPEVVSCDCHPDFYSSRLASALATRWDVPLIPIYHHAAHVGAVMAEYGRANATIGLALDGVGMGPEGAIWGGELLYVDSGGFERLGGMRALPLPGGDRAAKEPRRMGAAVLTLLGRESEIEKRWPTLPNAAHFAQLVKNSRLTKTTTSLGRWFDAASALLGLCDVQHDEAYAAMLLESKALGVHGRIMTGLIRVTSRELDLLPLMDYLANVREEDKAQAAADFHRTLAFGLAVMTRSAMERLGYSGPVALSGGCVANRLLTEALIADLRSLGVEALLPKAVPVGDGGIALGQAWLSGLAAARGLGLHAWRGQSKES